ncbi:NAD(P)H-hydrate dehydratase [Enterococcus cecorum]|nr:NAD(P)H-hydrate dehydratase [Enterococcus cecorum]
MLTALDETILSTIARRPLISHKGNFGRVCCIGGNLRYGGAIILATEACVYSGTGLTTTICDKENRPAIHARTPEAMIVDWQNLVEVDRVCQTADVIVIGPGLGDDPQCRTILQQVIQNQKENQWLVIDGSALSIMAEFPMDFQYPEKVVLTPHQMEWQRVSQIAIKDQTFEKNLAVQQKLQTNVVLKSHQTQIYLANQTQFINPLVNPGMATGGMGDSLAGMIGSFLAQFTDKEKAILAAVYLHSFIADKIAQESYVVLPSQLIQKIPYWMDYFVKVYH